jgi:hypothetical protein
MRIVFLMLISVMIMTANSQSENKAPVGDNQPANSLFYNQKEFGDRFSVLFNSEGDYDYYVIDLTKLKGRFERVYFMNLTYQDRRIVNLDPDVDKDQIWFKAFHQYSETEINCLFNDLKEKAAQDGYIMSSGEKSAWLAKNDKFKKTNIND